LGAVEGELGLLEREGLFPLAPALESLFVGGGTPSVLGPAAMSGLARILGLHRLQDPELEWTVEANPESFTREVADSWARAGVNRLSLGAQSFQESPLEWMGRLHGPGGPAEAVRRGRDVGIENISVDLMFGLPEGVERDWSSELDSALALEVPHLSLFGLTVEPQTPLGRAVAEGRVIPVGESRYGEEFLEASERFTDAGYRHYELSNFALPGFDARQNRAYWELRPYLGLGNGAHSYRFPLRRWNLREWNEYQRAIREERSPVEGGETLNPQNVRLEVTWLGLRTDAGIQFDGLPGSARELARTWIGKGWAVATRSGFRLTPAGWLLLDELAVDLDMVIDSVPSPS